MDSVKKRVVRITDRVPVEALDIKEENADVYEIEETDFVYEAAPHEVQVKITALNDKFEQETLKPYLVGLVKNSPCPCVSQGPRLKRRWDKNKEYDKKTGLVTGNISQQDFDFYKWGIVMRAVAGIDQEVLVTMRECKCCGRLETFGKTDVLTVRMAQLYMNNIDQLKKGDYMVENLDTGEMEPAPKELVDAITGGEKE